MKKFIGIIAILSSVLAYGEVQTVGLSGLYSNSFYKSKNEISPLPLLNITYKSFYIREMNIGYELYTEPEFKVSTFIEPFAGWKIKSKDMENGLKNISNRNYQIMGGFALDFDFSEDILGNINYSFGKKGSKGELSLTKIYPIGDRIIIMPTISFKYYQKDYLNKYVGITSNEVATNYSLNKKYSTTDSFSTGASITTEINITEQTIATVFIGIEYYDNKISNSPIVRSNIQMYGGIGVRYSF